MTQGINQTDDDDDENLKFHQKRVKNPKERNSSTGIEDVIGYFIYRYNGCL